ncbi:MAG: hypothetical protein ACRDKS_05380 [Actinomycetota bacterium]
MRAKAWAHRRVCLPLDGSRGAPLAEVAGDGRTRLRIHFDRVAAAAPVRGALSYPASWHAGRWGGDAVVSVIPQWSWGYELHFAVSPPGSIAGRVVWTRRRLERLANGLVSSLKDAAERSTRPRVARPARLDRASFAPATSSSR